MIRDNFFNMSRFVRICRKEMIESWRANLLRVVMMYGILTIAFVWNGYFQYKYLSGSTSVKEDPIWSFELIVFIWTILIMGTLSASFTMERMKTKTNRIAVLMTPATMFEKFFSRWIIFTFGYLIVFLIAFKLADWTRVLVYSMSYPDLKNIIASTPLSRLVGDDSQYWVAFRTSENLLLAISFYFFVQSIFVLGSSIWPKNAFVKTFSAIVILAVIYISIGVLLVKIFLEHKSGGFNDPISGDTIMALGTAFFFVMAIINWVLAYFRFKESEIINRW